MHNIKEIRKDFKSFQELIQKRNIKVDIDNIKKLDEINRELIQKKENYENLTNTIGFPSYSRISILLYNSIIDLQQSNVDLDTPDFKLPINTVELEADLEST